MQDSVSASLRLIIREHIERNGFIDATCGPVSQQPRRGRPVGSGSGQQRIDDADTDETDGSDDAAEADLDFGELPEPTKQAIDEPVGLQIAQATGRAAQGIAQQEQAAAEQRAALSTSTTATPEQDDSGPADMDDIFSTGRNR